MIYVHTLCYNLTNEVEKAIKTVYELNNMKYFIHIIVDLGFPLVKDEIPKNIRIAKKKNAVILEKMAKKYGSWYISFENKGVSPNWSKVYSVIKEKNGFKDNDCLICADPDERPITKGWIKAISDVLNSDNKYAWVSLTMPEQHKIFNPHNIIEKTIAGQKVFEIKGGMNWAQGGFSGEFLNKAGGVPYLDNMPIYGGIEHASISVMNELGYKWCMLPEHIVEHTDYEKGSKGSSRILREWKNDIIFNLDKQITFEEWLKKY